MAKTYTIQEAAAITQVSPHTLRFYERIGLLRITRAENGYRRYSDSDLGWVRFVLLLRGTNMPLPEIATFMQLEKDGQATIDKRRHMLETHREDLIRHMAELQGHLRALDAKIEYYRDTSAEVCDCVGRTEEDIDGISSTRTNGYQSESVVPGVNDLWQRDG